MSRRSLFLVALPRRRAENGRREDIRDGGHPDPVSDMITEEPILVHQFGSGNLVPAEGPCPRGYAGYDIAFGRLSCQPQPPVFPIVLVYITPLLRPALFL